MNNEQKFVDVNGAQVMDLTPDYNRKLALVDLTVLKKLTSLLESTTIACIRDRFQSKLEECFDIEEYINMLSEELAFHTTVNLIKEVTGPPLPKVVGNIDLENRDETDCY